MGGVFRALIALASALLAMETIEGGVCPPSRCSLNGPDIRFPFWKEGDPLHCGYPGFKLACKGNDTVLQLPPSGDFLVTSISYVQQQLTITDQKNCSVGLLLRLNSSISPYYSFNYDVRGGNGLRFPYPYSIDLTLLTCSTSSYGFRLVPCLTSSDNSSSKHFVYAVRSSLNLAAVPSSCQMMKTVSLPYHYRYETEYEPEYSFWFDTTGNSVASFNLFWSVPGCEFCDHCGFKNRDSNKTRCFDSQFLDPPGNIDSQFLDPPGSKSGNLTKKIIIGACAGIFTLTIAMVVVLRVCHYRRHNKKKEMENQINVEKFLADYKSLKPTRYSYADIKRISDQFKTKLGEGGYGTVFKGVLPNGKPVAVKILKRSASLDDGGEFINEMGTIGTIHHVNVVRLLGFCADGYRRALIYEFMPNGSLAKVIFSDDALLDWEKLQEIAVGIARGIEYLHQGCQQRILHFDIKPHNILLDQNFIPKISDFGLAKLCSKDQSIISMTAARGTIGYIAPELLSRNFGNVSYKSDVYSFGMLVLEMVGGRKNTDPRVENASQIYFPEWIYNQLCGGEGLGIRIAGGEDAQIARRLTTVAMWCIQWYPVDRPSMKSVVQMLEGNMENLTMPPDPFTYVNADPSNEVADISAKSQDTNLVTISEEVEEEQQV